MTERSGINYTLRQRSQPLTPSQLSTLVREIRASQYLPPDGLKISPPMKSQ